MTIFWIGCALAVFALLAAWIAEYRSTSAGNRCGRTGGVPTNPEVERR
jgi:hypothetical protein